MFASFKTNATQSKEFFPKIFDTIALINLSPVEQSQINQLRQRIDLAMQVFENLDLADCFIELSGALARQLSRGNLPNDPTLLRITDKLMHSIATIREQNSLDKTPSTQSDAIDNAITIKEEIKNLKEFLRRMQPPSTPMSFDPPSRFRTVAPGKEKDPAYWKEILRTFWNTSEIEEYVYNGVPVLIHQDGRQHLPVFFSMSDTGSLVVSGNKRVLAAAIVHHDFDELPEA